MGTETKSTTIRCTLGVSAAFTENAAIKNCTPGVPFNDISMTITDTCVTRRSHYSSDDLSTQINVGSNYSNLVI